jgi:hypothetical protein
MSLLKVNTVQTDTLKSIAGVNRNSVLQVVNKEVTTNFTSTSVTFVDATDMFLAITPTSSTSKIMVMFNTSALVSRTSTGNYMDFQILRDSTVVFRPGYNNGTGNLLFGFNAGAATSMNIRGIVPLCFLDSPSTTNEIVYKLQTSIYVNSNSGSIEINNGGSKSTITLMEIAQ